MIHADGWALWVFEYFDYMVIGIPILGAALVLVALWSPWDND